jgi:predicted nucleic acid-binding Zn ribbon protein
VWISLKNLIPTAASRFNMKKQINKSEICVLWSKMAMRLLGKQSEERFKPISFKNKTLLIKCPSSVWANELQMRQYELVEKLNQSAGGNKVERINFIF